MAESIKDIADELGVSKTAIRKRMTDEFRKTQTEKQGNKILIKDEGVAELKRQFEEAGTINTSDDNSVDDHGDESELTAQELEILSDQLTSQNDQLKEKDRQIAELHKLLDQSQQLQLDVQQRMKKIEGEQKPVAAIETAATTDSVAGSKTEVPEKKANASHQTFTNPKKQTKRRGWWPFGRKNN